VPATGSPASSKTVPLIELWRQSLMSAFWSHAPSLSAMRRLPARGDDRP
jgi:hypothetical protein